MPILFKIQSLEGTISFGHVVFSYGKVSFDFYETFRILSSKNI